MNLNTDTLYKQLRIPKIDERNYWLVRSNGGEYYDDFFIHKYIAIAWDYISLAIMNNKNEGEIKAIIDLNEKSQPTKNELTEEELNAGVVTTIYNKIYRFTKEFKTGDVVLVPSKNSEFISIGIIESEVYEDPSYIIDYLEENPLTEITLCPYSKRRKVNWLRQISKSKLDIYLSKAFSSHHAISSVNEYAEYIDRNIYSIYLKGQEMHSTLHAGHPNGLTLRELVELSSSLESSLMDLSENFGLEYRNDNYMVKINIHSPGLMEFIGIGAGAGVCISILMFAINNLRNGGKFKIGLKVDSVSGNVEFSLESETKGERGRDFEFKELELRHQEELLKLVEDLQIKSPEFIVLNSEQSIEKLEN